MPITIDKPSKYFNTVLYTGNASTQSITGVGFKPDFVWIKGRSGTYGVSNHKLYDVVRGATKTIWSNLTTAETTQTNTVTSFDTDGFSLGDDTNVNWSSTTYASWNWLASNTSGSSNTSGTITSTVSANTTSGFSIVSWTGNATNSTIGHSLGVTPALILSKNRTDVDNWSLWHQKLSATSGKYMTFNDTGAEQTDSTIWNTAPTSTVFGVGTNNRANGNGDAMIAFCWSEVKGFSKAFSYTGNGSTDGTYVHLGFRPAFVILKRTDTTSSWAMYDNKRSAYNVMNIRLLANTSGADDTSADNNIDFVSNGIKFRTSVGWNASGGKYIGFAIAEQPYVSSKGIVANAR